MKKIPVILTFLSFMGLQAYNQPLQTVDQVDIEKYMGRWYDIASYPARFLKECRCTTADYEIVPGKKFIRVTNRCIRFRNGRSEIVTAQGKAFVIEGSKNTKLKVQFFWPFRGDYYIIGLAEDYSWAIVGHPTRKYLWILSRDSFVPTHTYNYILKVIGEQGYDVNRLVKTPQNCDSAK